jgi:hypothetical protein
LRRFPPLAGNGNQRPKLHRSERGSVAQQGRHWPNRFIDIWPPLRYVFLASNDHDYCAIAFRHELAAKDESCDADLEFAIRRARRSAASCAGINDRNY